MGVGSRSTVYLRYTMAPLSTPTTLSGFVSSAATRSSNASGFFDRSCGVGGGARV